jgi:hypothetical protein
MRSVWKRYIRANGVRGGIWKLEPQRDGAAHVHLLVDHGRPGDDIAGERAWWSQAWYEVVGSGLVKHLQAGVQCDVVRDWSGVAAYAGKYLGKAFEADPGWTKPGRFWGIFGRSCWPVSVEDLELEPGQADQFQRQARSWYKRQLTARVRIQRQVERTKNGRRVVAQVVDKLPRWSKGVRQALGDATGGVEVRPVMCGRWPGRPGQGLSMFMPPDVVLGLLLWSTSIQAEPARPAAMGRRSAGDGCTRPAAARVGEAAGPHRGDPGGGRAPPSIAERGRSAMVRFLSGLSESEATHGVDADQNL